MQTMGELLERNARNYPQGVAYVVDRQRATWEHYLSRIRRLSSALNDAGIKRQDRIGILSTNCMEYAELYGVCEWAGFILAAYNFRLAAPELAWLLEDSAPSIVFFEAQFAPKLEGLRARFPGVQRWIRIGEPTAGAATPAWAEAYEHLLARGDLAGAPFRARADDYVYLFYTSGTTGRPKGAPYRHRGALATALQQGRKCGDDLRILQVTPMFHIGGKGFPLAAAWMAGTTVIGRAFEPLRFLETLQAERITFTFMVAPMIQAVLDHPRLGEFDLSSLRAVMSASAAIPVPLLRRAIEKFGQVFYVAYGATEAGGICTLERHELRPGGTPQEVQRLASVGHFDPEADATILDEAGQPCPANLVGEICVKSPVFEGYWNNTVATIEATRTGWLHTGDLGYQDEEGFVYLVDRKKDMIISGGENIYSREVEEALHRHDAVLDAAVIGMPDAKWGETVRALVVLKPDQAISESELIAFSQTQIARYKCPKSIDFVSELPRLGSGKVDKVTLRRTYRERQETGGQS
jgi:acyl-CoA synthetase (AMP-forming)/AMP-acid ligase II